MSISENTRSVLSKEVTIRYIAPNSRNNSATGKSNDSSAVRSFTTSTCSNPTGIAESSHFITLEDNKEDEADGDAFDSAKEVDEEEENEQNDEQHVNSKLDFDSNSTLKCGQNDDDDLDEKVAMECKVVKQDEYKATADDAPLPLLDTATFSTDQAPDKLISKANLKSILARFQKLRHRHHSLPFLRFRLIFAAFLFAAIFMLPSFLTGFITGLYISFLVFLFLCVSDPMAKNHHSSDQQMCCKKVLNQIALKSAQQEKSGKIYKGWMNILNEHYHPHTFHVNTIQTVLVRLDGNLLRICRPELKMLKHAFHVDPTLTETEPRMVAQSIYDLTGATVKLRPQRLARRRWFSRKYPICIKLAKFDDGAGTEVGPGAPMATRLRRPLLKKQSDTDSTATSTLPEEAEAAAGEEQQKFAPERKTIARMQMQQSNSSESDDLSELSDAELPLRHSLSDFTFGSNGHPAKRQPKKRRQSGRYIFLFGRSAREKERWFHKLRQASSKYTADVSLPNYESNSPRRRVSFDSLGNIADRMSKDFLLYSLQQFQFTKQMALLLDQMSEKFTESECGVVAMDLGLNKWTRPSNVVSDHFVLLVNLLATRGFYDFCRDKYWCEAVRNKIQTKLATIHLPYFIETLELSTFDLGTSVPKIVKVYQPKVDEWGIWCDFEIKYHGLIKLGLETRVNLMKLKSVSEFMADDTTNPSSSNGDDKAGQLPFCSSAFRTSPSRYSDEEMPESPETSPDEEFGAKLKEFTSKRQKTGQKILSLVDRFTHSKYFRDAVELRPVRKMMEEISSTRLMLNVEVTELEGTMTANLAAPPSDRLWYAFRTPPQMSIKAIPQVGERSVVYSALSEWIENKLQLILEKNLVLPNMDDVVIPIMSGNQLLQGNLNR